MVYSFVKTEKMPPAGWYSELGHFCTDFLFQMQAESVILNEKKTTGCTCAACLVIMLSCGLKVIMND